MEENDIYSAIATALSAIAALATWFWKIEPLNFLFTFILGSLVTYSVQSKLQDRSDKKKIIKEIIEKIYGPLYVELQKIDDKLVNGFETIYHSEIDFGGEAKCGVWEEINTYPMFFSIPKNLRDEIDHIITISERINHSIDEIERIITPILFEVSNSIMSPNYQNVQGLYVEYKSKRGTILFSSNILNYIILNIDPVDDMKLRFQDYTIDCFFVGIVMGAHYIPIPFIDEQGNIYKIIETTTHKINQEKEVSTFITDRATLAKRINKVLPRIERYIDKNYSTIKIK